MNLLLNYRTPAADTEEGWEKYSLPIGCSALGASVFGGVEREHIQITENSLENPGSLGGLNSFADIFISFDHAFAQVSDYTRTLDISNAVSTVKYDYEGIRFQRTFFASYPDRAIVCRIVSGGPAAFSIAMEIPFLTEEEGRRKTGEVIARNNEIQLRGRMEAFNVRFEGNLRLYTDGVCAAEGEKLTVSGATDSYLVFCGATNYELCPEVFTNHDNRTKIRDFDPHEKARSLLENACRYSYEDLLERHESDYHELFDRVSLDLGEDMPEEDTESLIRNYSSGQYSRYLETLYFQFGRYLLISSSRPGCLPANLQGVWNYHDKSPWGSGYWHNINVQMNYWPAFVTRLDECFEAYLSYYNAFLPEARRYAYEYIRNVNPENLDPGEKEDAYGWSIGTGNYAYTISGSERGGHSGPGTGGLTSKLFWEYYAFSGDRKRLREVTYPALLEMARYLTRVVRDYDGKLLSSFSASPEQIISNVWSKPVHYYHTVGCAFDQQMIWENNHDLLRCVEILGEETLPDEDRKIIERVRSQMERYDPVQIGWSGQVKEYREEHFYGEIGEYTHRHISHLVGLYPGTLISHDTPAWLDGARVALDHRTDQSTGWATAHRLNAWARTGDGNRAYRLYRNLLSLRTYPNLWDTHPPFQIDGNFGGTSGIAEMLLQSHEAYIRVLPAIPDEWDHGRFQGLAARGGFVFDVEWKNGSARTIRIFSARGGRCPVSSPNIALGKSDFPMEKIDADRIVIPTAAGETYRIREIPAGEKMSRVTNLTANRKLELRWECSEPVCVFRAVDSASDYELAAENVRDSWKDDFDFAGAETLTYKVTAGKRSIDPGALVTINHSTQLERERYAALVRQLNIPQEIPMDTYLGQ